MTTLDAVHLALTERYEFVATLGEGGMAFVSRMRDRKLGRDVALKVLKPALTQTVAAERFLEREGRLGIRDTVLIARQVSAALSYAHRNGVVHRDIKPENILLPWHPRFAALRADRRFDAFMKSLRREL